MFKTSYGIPKLQSSNTKSSCYNARNGVSSILKQIVFDKTKWYPGNTSTDELIKSKKLNNQALEYIRTWHKEIFR